MGDRKQLIKIIKRIIKLTINNLGYMFLWIILVLAKIIMMVTQIVRSVSLKDIVSDAISSVIME